MAAPTPAFLTIWTATQTLAKNPKSTVMVKSGRGQERMGKTPKMKRKTRKMRKKSKMIGIAKTTLGMTTYKRPMGLVLVVGVVVAVIVVGSAVV